MNADADDQVREKPCTKCEEVKAFAEFYFDKRRGHPRAICKACHKIDMAEWRAGSKEEIKEYNDRWYKENRVERNKKARAWQASNPGKVEQYQAAWKENNPDRVREISKKHDDKKRATPKGRLENVVKASVHRGLTKGAKNGRHTFDLLAYSLGDLMAHLESMFLPGMTWENYGKGGWHVDHIVPLSAHNYSSPDDLDFKRAWALSNLQPLWAADNIKKKDKLSAPFQPSLAFGAANDNCKENDEAA